MSHFNLCILSKHASTFQKLVEPHLPVGLRLGQVTTHPSALNPNRVCVLLADPDLAAEVVPHTRGLMWCQSTWAGNAPLLKLEKKNYLLTGVKGLFGPQMREFVFAYLLYFSRHVSEFELAQRTIKTQRWNPPSYSRLKGKTLGILGAGSIAAELVPAADAFGMSVIGLSRRGEDKTGFQQMYTPTNKLEFASQCDFVVNLLPDTSESNGFIDNDFLASLPQEAVLINVGRGSAIVDTDLLAALDAGQLRAAVLDVFNEEPLPDTHVFWDHPKVLVTQHTAAESFPEDIARLFLLNAKRFVKGQKLNFIFDFERGY